MKIAYNWLQNFIEVDSSVEEVGDILTEIGLEVEGIKEFEPIQGGLNGVVVGEVISCEQHPNADRLKLTKVDIGAETPLQIVCGAPNVATGQKVAVATIGTVLPSDGDKEFKIKKGKIRGELSEGMICAEDEMGIGSSHDGILVLDNNLEVGTPFVDLLEDMKNDSVIEIGLTPNRADAMSHFGVARDLLVATKHRGVSAKWIDLEDNELTKINDLPITVEVKDTEKCIRYTGVCIDEIEIKDSPVWLQNRLKSIGLKPINNVVDATNYVLHHLGQPLHAFDYDKIDGQQIIVKTTAQNTTFKTLDEVERKLDSSDLMICNSKEPMCIAGVFGGADSGVSSTTQRIFLESAYFDAVSVRKTAKRHQLNTDSSFRFERGVDPNFTLVSLKYAAHLICEITGGKIASDIIDTNSEEAEPFKVSLRFHKVDELVGERIHRQKIKDILSDLDIQIASDGDLELELEVPPYRVDVQRECDIIEEVLRIYGYNNVAIPSKVNATIQLSDELNFKHNFEEKIANSLVGLGFVEGMNNSLTKSSYVEKYDEKKSNSAVKLLNPLSNDLNVLRQYPLFGLLESVNRNINRKYSNIKLFEFGYTYNKYASGYQEDSFLSLCISGNASEIHWAEAQKKNTFFHLKGTVESILNQLLDVSITFNPSKDILLSNALDIQVGKSKLGFIGKVSTSVLSDFDISQEVFYAQLDRKKLLEVYNSELINQDLPLFQEIEKDMAFELDEEVTYTSLEKAILGANIKELLRVSLFDVYEGDKIAKGKKSYAVKMKLLGENTTLTDKQIEKIMNKIEKSVERIGGKLRK